jgi:formylglycine-generating enzyme required for sulfatase activity
MVFWDDAVAFCKKLSELPDEKKAGRVYRLPAGAEWEYACRAGTRTAYSFGDDASKLGEYAWFGGIKTHPVGQKLPNSWGLHDMHGNVWELLNDVLIRGGSYLDAPITCRSACSSIGYQRGQANVGLRVVCDVQPAAEK